MVTQAVRPVTIYLNMNIGLLETQSAYLILE